MDPWRGSVAVTGEAVSLLRRTRDSEGLGSNSASVSSGVAISAVGSGGFTKPAGKDSAVPAVAAAGAASSELPVAGT